MGLRIGEDTLCILQFAGNQIVVSSDKDDQAYMTRKLTKVYEEARIKMNLKKTQYPSVGRPDKEGNITPYQEYTYLRITFTKAGNSEKDLTSKMNKARNAIRCINPVL